MNRICLTKDGKLIEMQSGGDDREDLMEMRLDTLKQNALNAGYKEEDIEVKWATDEETAAIMEANKPPNQDILNKIAALESQQTPRRIRDWIKGTDNGFMIDLEKQIAELRSQLK